MNPARVFPLTLATFLAIASLSNRGDAAAVIEITESGGNVIVSATGSLDTAGLIFLETSDTAAGINSSASFLEVSTGSVDLFQSITGPSSFGSGDFTFASSGTGDRFGVRFGISALAVPAGYVSGAPLAGTSTFTDSSFAQLGLVPGFYMWTWGSGANVDSLSIKVVDPARPIQATLDIDTNQNPVLRWQGELGCRYSISYSTDLINYVSIAKGFPFGGAVATNLAFTDLPVFTRTLPKGFYKVEKDPATNPNSADMLTAFFADNGGKAGFTNNQVKALETVMFALDEIEAGQLVAARARVDAMIAAYPFSTGGWYNGLGYRGLNLGSPIGYYSVRMLDQILTLGNPSRKGKLRMTAVVAPHAMVTRPTLPDFAPETLRLAIDPQILANDAHRLHQSTRLFRRWVQAITGGLELELKVHVMDQDATVISGNDTPGITTSYPNSHVMVDSVPTSLAATTDLWWVIAPSGVPGNGSGFNTEFITGGMGAHTTGVPLLVCDDAWLTRKPAHLGSGPYSEVELMMYQPNWLQHEFMHHLFKLYPEFGLEVTGHQWFTRSTWPADFVGNGEPDYYHEALTKRILGATPPLAKTLTAKKIADMSVYPLAKLVGTYQRRPVENSWHDVTISLTNGNLQWNNAAGVSWGLEVIGTDLWRVASNPSDVRKSPVQIDENNEVVSILYYGEPYVRIPAPVNELRASLSTNLVSGSLLPPTTPLMPRSPTSGLDKATAGDEAPDHRHCPSCFRP